MRTRTGTAAERPQRNSGTRTLSRCSSDQSESDLSNVSQAIRDLYPHVAEALKRLCAWHAQAEFTPFTVQTWCASLTPFQPAEINRAILEVGLGVDPFPSIGKIIDRINANRARNSKHVINSERKRGHVPDRQLSEIAKALNLKID